MTEIPQKNKKGSHFRFALTAVFLSIFISLFAFISEDNKITGFATYTVAQPSLIEFEDINALRSLAAGNYFIDGNGLVYWLDDESRPVIGKISSIGEVYKNRHIYIDADGDIGYVLK